MMKQHFLQRFYWKVILILSVAGAMCFQSNALFSSDSDSISKSRAEIEQQLQKWSQDFNAGRISEVCGLFAPDLIASYPGVPDRNYDAMCQHLTAALTGSEKINRYELPEIEQVIINGDFAAVRLIWTLRIFDKNKSEIGLVKEKGLDVLRRQNDGKWKIVISYAYPLVHCKV